MSTLQNAWHRWRENVTPSHGAAMYALIKEVAFHIKDYFNYKIPLFL